MEELKRLAQAKEIFEDNEQQVLVLQEKLKILRIRHQDDKKELEEENEELRQELGRSKKELRFKSHHISLLHAIVGRMQYLSKQMLNCRPPSSVCTLFL